LRSGALDERGRERDRGVLSRLVHRSARFEESLTASSGRDDDRRAIEYPARLETMTGINTRGPRIV
jgi:hypothetical protein